MLAVAAALVLTSQPAEAQTPCPEPAVCAERDGVFIAAGSEDQAETLLEAAINARVEFNSVMGVTMTRTAVVMDPDLRPAALNAAREAGFDTIKTWTSAARTADMIRTQLAAAISATQPDQTVEEIEATILPMIERRLADEGDIIAHELGHAWFGNAFDWPPAPMGSGRYYGVPASPDWLDETAAVLMEGEASSQDRWTTLCTRRPRAASADFYIAFFEQLHPSQSPEVVETEQTIAEFDQEEGSPEGTRIVVRARPGALANATANDAGDIYYPLVRGLIDYVAAQNGDAPIWGDVARWIADGGDFDGWLAAHGETHGLAGDVPALSQDWSVWLAESCAQR
jgi:hypothetical protein